MNRSVTVREQLVVRAPPERVWYFTQDYRRRASWDPSIRSVEILEEGPPPLVRIRATGGLTYVLRYKAFHRPARTSATMEDVRSRLVAGGGGSWAYEPHP